MQDSFLSTAPVIRGGSEKGEHVAGCWMRSVSLPSTLKHTDAARAQGCGHKQVLTTKINTLWTICFRERDRKDRKMDPGCAGFLHVP